MKIFGKNLKEYWQDLKIYFIIVLLISIAQTGAVFLKFSSFKTADPVGLVKLALIFLASWFAVRRSGFNLKQAAFIGAFLFLATVWMIPLDWFFLPPIPAVFKLLSLAIALLLNLCLYTLIALMGAAAAKIFNKLNAK